jgi:hypothetical protein
VRAAQNRRTDHPERSLWPTLAAAPLAATVQIQVGARAGQPTCKAQLEVR